MEDKQKELSITMGADTKKLATGKKDIGKTIGNESTKTLDKNQIPVSLEKREKELEKRRSQDN